MRSDPPSQALRRIREQPRILAVGAAGAVAAGASLWVAFAVLGSPGGDALDRATGLAATLAVFELLRGGATGALFGAARPALRADDARATDLSGWPTRARRYATGAVLFRTAGGAVVAVAAAVFLGAYLPVATALRAVGYALGVDQGSASFWVGVGGGLPAFAALAVGVGTAGVAGTHLHDRGYRESFRTALRTFRAAPRRSFVRGVVLTLVSGVPVGVALLAVRSGYGTAGAAAGVLTVGTVAYAVAAVYRSTDPAPVGRRRSTPASARVALFATLLVVASFAAATVRVTDVRPRAGPDGSPGYDADAPYESLRRGVSSLDDRSVTAVMRVVVVDTDDGRTIPRSREVRRFDRVDREYSSYAFVRREDRWEFEGFYVTEGVLLRRSTGTVPGPSLSATRTGGSWNRADLFPRYTTDQHYRAWASGAARFPSVVPPSVFDEVTADDWQVVGRSGGNVTFRTDQTLRTPVTVTIDAETGRPVEMSVTGQGRYGLRKRIRIRYRYGDVDVERPANAPDRRPEELLYDVLQY